MDTLSIANTIVDALAEKKAENILLIDLKGIAAFTDYFIICTASSSRMLNALADGVISRTRLDHKRKGRIEGQPEAGWMILDYGSIVVHLFDEQMRRYFKLEELWNKGKVILHVQ